MKRSKFSLSHYKLLSCDMGQLVPIGCTEVLPGDSIQQATSALVRVSPLLAPVMHPVDVRIHHWFVPTRIVWPSFENFITGGPDGMDDRVRPYFLYSEAGRDAPLVGSLADYLGLPPGLGATNAIEVSAIPFRCYAKIWNEWYRDQDLQPELVIDTNDGDDGPDTTTSDELQHVAWEKDRFTSARPWTQKGPEVTLPFGTTAPVEPIGPTGQPLFSHASGPASTPLQVNNGESQVRIDSVVGGDAELFWQDPQLQADLSAATAVSINDLREAFALQRYEEARARYGSRYTEYLRYLGVKSSDARLQRPEYLGGGKQTIQFSEVLQTAPSEIVGEEPLGRMGGHGITALRSNRYRRFFEEHGYILSLMSVKPKTMYADGIQPHWSRLTKHDYFQVELQHIGQAAILGKELYHASATPNATWGYQDRYDEYRRQESGIAGQFRTDLDFWHYARLFSAAPVLNADFIRSEPTKRVNAVGGTNHVLWIMAKHSMQARRLVAGSAGSFIR